MRKASLLAIVLSVLPNVARADAFGPTNCHFFRALTFSADRKSDDSAAFNRLFDFRPYRAVSFNVVWASLTGTVNGSCKVQVTNKPSPASGDWVDKSGATFDFVGASGSDMISITSVPEAYYRLTCSHGLITGGTIDGYCVAKE